MLLYSLKLHIQLSTLFIKNLFLLSELFIKQLAATYIGLIIINSNISALGSASKFAVQYGQDTPQGTNGVYQVAANLSIKISLPQTVCNNCATTNFTWKKGSAGTTNNLVFNNGFMRFGGDGTLIASGDIVAYGSPSDSRLKIIKEKIPNALESVLKLNGYKFDWKKTDHLKNYKEDIGVIAQEVKQVID
jgi:hypothetical protein